MAGHCIQRDFFRVKLVCFLAQSGTYEFLLPVHREILKRQARCVGMEGATQLLNFIQSLLHVPSNLLGGDKSVSSENRLYLSKLLAVFRAHTGEQGG